MAETGTTSYGTDKPMWLRQMFNSVARDFPRVAQVTFFMANKLVERTVNDWGLNTPQVRCAERMLELSVYWSSTCEVVALHMHGHSELEGKNLDLRLTPVSSALF